MKKSIYKRLRIGGIMLCMLLVLACVIPVAVFAESSSSIAEQDSVHFINPTAITVVGDYLFVADNVEDGKCAVICFDARDSKPEPKYTYVLDNMTVDGLSNNGENVIYAFGKSKVVELALRKDAMPTVGKTYDKFPEGVTIKDFAYGNVVMSTENKTMYALTETYALQYINGEFVTFANIANITKTAGLLSVCNGDVSYLYYLHDNTCDRYNLKINGQDSAFAQKLQLTSGFTPTGIFALTNKVALYNNTEIYVIEESALHIDTVAELSLSKLYGADCSIVDIIAYGERLFVLNSKNQIDIFDKIDTSYDTTNYATIGSDMVDKTVPTAYTSFTLVRPTGYPTNIVYKTNADTSISEILTDASEYVILGYNGDETSHYYYVLVGDKFGWVKKSDGASSPESDNKLTVVNNRLGDSEIGYTAKFVTLNAVYVYELPLSNATKKAVTQTASEMKNVNVLQRFVEGEQVWYLVEYDKGVTGFVKKEDVGQFHIAAKTEDIPVIGQRKINSSLFSAVNMYASAELNEDESVTDSDGNVIKLYSGDIVTLIKTEGESAFISVRTASDGERSYGWIDASRLIGKNKMTTNAIVGLSLIAFALILAGTLIFVFLHRKKKIKANRD